METWRLWLMLPAVRVLCRAVPCRVEAVVGPRYSRGCGQEVVAPLAVVRHTAAVVPQLWVAAAAPPPGGEGGKGFPCLLRLRAVPAIAPHSTVEAVEAWGLACTAACRVSHVLLGSSAQPAEGAVRVLQRRDAQ